jgi:threonine dehydratase
VISVDHDRTASDVGIGEVDVFLHLETRGAEHCDHVRSGLRDRGFRVHDD